MGRLLLVCRLAARDLRRRPGEAALLLLAITAATATLTLGLVLHGVTDKPYRAPGRRRPGRMSSPMSPRPRPATATSPPTAPASRRWQTLPTSPATAVRTRSSRPR
jgi:putative ABC transport system permease protein